MKKSPEDFQEALDYINFRQRLINIAKTKDILLTIYYFLLKIEFDIFI